MVNREKFAIVTDTLRGVRCVVAERSGRDGVLVNYRLEHGDGRVRVAGVGGRRRALPAGASR